MKPRRDLSNNRAVSKENEAFNLDIVEIKDAYQGEEYLSKEFDYRFKYKLRSVVFYPKHKVKINFNYSVLSSLEFSDH